jgi:ribosome-associated heat shock protein Hsp15
VKAVKEAAKPPRTRLDKWLWAARLYKTRGLAADEIDRGRVRVNGGDAKPGRELHVGDAIEVRQGALTRAFVVQALSDVRGPAPIAQELYFETAESIAAREAAAERRRMGLVDPAQSIEAGRPTKRDRRQLVDWQRWSASLDSDS